MREGVDMSRRRHANSSIGSDPMEVRFEGSRRASGRAQSGSPRSALHHMEVFVAMVNSRRTTSLI